MSWWSNPLTEGCARLRCAGARVQESTLAGGFQQDLEQDQEWMFLIGTETRAGVIFKHSGFKILMVICTIHKLWQESKQEQETINLCNQESIFKTQKRSRSEKIRLHKPLVHVQKSFTETQYSWEFSLEIILALEIPTISYVFFCSGSQDLLSQLRLLAFFSTSKCKAAWTNSCPALTWVV